MTNPGQFSMWLGLVAIGTSSIFYAILQANRDNGTVRKVARLSFIGFATSVTVSSMLLMHFILNHEFIYSYVIRYSSQGLPLIYLVSSFWAGQEGSFLLWVLIGAWLGIVLMYKARDMEPQVMLIYNLTNVFLMILLIKQSPFQMVPMAPADGNGLNMLLQDPWMAIHPPIVFLGYAAFAIPFAYAISALWRRDYDGWIKTALPWTIFAFVTLGAGIIIGGFWSYKVLGWGGYWGWDPVENASLLPWLAGMALMHGMLLQLATKKLRKTNFFLAALSFLLVIYCTFLTRSGVLVNFSVHSFTDLGITGWLVFYMGVFTAISLWLFITRAKEIPVSKGDRPFHYFSREFGLIGAVVILCISCIVTGLGTSAPLITSVLEKASKVSTEFYVNTNLPLAILMLFLLSFVPLMAWRKNSLSRLAPKLIWALVGAVLSGVITLLNGYPGVGVLLLSILSGSAAAMNIVLAMGLLRKKVSLSSGAIAHMGLGLMFVGVVSSSVYDRSEKVSLPQGKTKASLGYDLVFKGPITTQEPRGSRMGLPLDITKGGRQFVAEPGIRTERLKNGELKRFTSPHIRRGLVADLYIASLDFQPGKDQVDSGNAIILKKAEKVRFQNYELTFTAFDVSGMTGKTGTHNMTVGAKIEAAYKDADPVLLEPAITVGQLHSPSSRVKLPGSEDAFLTLVAVDAGNKAVRLEYQGPAADQQNTQTSPSSMIAEVSIKPGMTVLWLGTLLMMVGGCIGIARRWVK
jgi:cytochrome c-type biogenesis protein CcmF